MNTNKLTNKQRRFVDEYLKDFNATQAAIRAGYSQKSAALIGCENIRKPNIEAEISRWLDERAMRSNEIVDRLTSHSKGDMGDFVDISGVSFSLNLRKAKELGLTHLIKKVKDRVVMTSDKDGNETETHHIEIELYDAHAALVDLGKIRGLFIDRIGGADGGPIEIKDLSYDDRIQRAFDIIKAARTRSSNEPTE